MKKPWLMLWPGSTQCPSPSRSCLTSCTTRREFTPGELRTSKTQQTLTYLLLSTNNTRLELFRVQSWPTTLFLSHSRNICTTIMGFSCVVIHWRRGYSVLEEDYEHNGATPWHPQWPRSELMAVGGLWQKYACIRGEMRCWRLDCTKYKVKLQKSVGFSAVSPPCLSVCFNIAVRPVW